MEQPAADLRVDPRVRAAVLDLFAARDAHPPWDAAGTAVDVAGARGDVSPTIASAMAVQIGDDIWAACAAARFPIRARALLAPPRARPAQVGPFLFDPAARTLAWRGSSVRLTEKEAAILAALAATGPGGMTRERLLTAVWGYTRPVETHTLESHIYRLRQKMDAHPPAPALLRTTEVGYALIQDETPSSAHQRGPHGA